MIKYLILDMGRVLVEPDTGDWLITSEFLKNVDMSKIEKEELKKAIQDSRWVLDGKAETLVEEYKIVAEFYKMVFEKINYKISKENFENIVNNFVYDEDDSKYLLYENVKEDLEKHNIYKYFTKIYISSVYGERKQDKVFFDYPIKDFNIQKDEALFIDDNEELLDIAVEKGLKVLHMDRNNVLKKSKYKIINDFSEIL